ncbi:type I methionyl aminopeptidase [Lentzea sp. NPDC005914]|uniref:type I methionyl aminopeptidase n=1 Tax=Lentzea sp. NPDC005914 TaxID=3154572 RepID=UPI0033F55E63
MIELKSAADLEVMREAGRVVAQALAACQAAAAPGVTPKDLDEIAREVIFGAGATSPFLDYHPKWAPSPFPGVICASVNDVVVHGIPGPLPLREGDLVSIDCGAQFGGMTGDAAISFVVGEAAPADLALIDCTTRALQAGIEAARPGGRLGDISHAIGEVARAAGYGQLAFHGGHGIGREMHEEPFVPNKGSAGEGMELVPGLVLALEPMLHAGGRDWFRTDEDGWTLRTDDGSRAAHVEHTVAITADGPVVLTLL